MTGMVLSVLCEIWDPVKSPVGQKPHGQKPHGQKPHGQKPHGQKPGWSKAPNKQTSKFQNKFIGYLHM